MRKGGGKGGGVVGKGPFTLCDKIFVIVSQTWQLRKS